MEQHTYDNESVQELLDWAKKMVETNNYPTERFKINKCTTIIDGKHYLETLIAMISRNWENPTFHPTIEQLWEFREKWENREAHKQKCTLITPDKSAQQTKQTKLTHYTRIFGDYEK